MVPGIVKKYWHYLIGVAIFAYLLSQINIHGMFSVLSSANPFLVAVGLLLGIPMFALKALRWRYLMHQLGIHYGVKDSVLMYFSGVYLGFITPGKVAELLKVTYLARDGHSFGKSFFTVFFDRLADLLFLAFVGFAGLFLLRDLFSSQVALLSLVAMLEVAVAFIFIIKKDWAVFILKKLLGRLLPGKFRDSVHSHIDDFYSSMGIFGFKVSFAVIFFTALSYLAFFISSVLFAESLGVSVGIIPIVVAVSIGALVTVIPVSIAGLGVRDATLLLLLAPLGVSREVVIAYSTLFLLSTLFITAFCSIGWFKKPMRKGF